VRITVRELQEYLDKATIGQRILNLGCGRNNPPDCFGIDILPFEGVDLVADINLGIPLPDDSFDLVIANDFLEHLDPKNKISVMENIYRVLAPGGVFQFEVPSTDGNNRGAFSDPTHISYFNEISFWYFLDDQYGKGFRSLYNIQTWFKPLSLETYYNIHNITYVRGQLQKLIKD
jgi:SAM-dependent methyltransferase